MTQNYFLKSKNLISKILEKIIRANSFVDRYKKFGKVPALPSNAFINMASTMFSQGMIHEAEDMLRSAVCFPSKSSNALLNLGVIKQSMGDFDQAIKFYLAAYKKDKSNAKSLVLWGNCLAIMGNSNDAIKKYEHAIKINPEEAEAFLSWGALLIKKKQYTNAKEKLELALQHSKNDLRPLYMIGIVNIELGCFDAALDFLKQVVNCTENNHEALHNIAYVYFKMERYDDAISYAKKALAIFQYKIETYLLLGDICALKNNECESLSFYKMAEMNGLKTFYLYISWATSLQKFGHHAEAIEKLELANELLANKNNDEVYARLALSLWITDNDKSALENVLTALKINPNNNLANYIYAEIEAHKNNFSHAIELLKKCEKDYETKARNHILQSLCYIELQDINSSKTELDKAFEHANKSETEMITDRYLHSLIEHKLYGLVNSKMKEVIKHTTNETILNNYFIITYNLAKQNSYKYNIEKSLEIIKRIENLGYELRFNDEKAELEGLLKNHD